MIDGSSILIRLMYFLSKNNDDSAKKFQDLLHNGKLFAWISTFQTLSTKIQSHFIGLRSLLLNFMNMDGNTDYEEELEKYNENFEKALDTICPIKGGGDEKRRFFIEGICECVGVGFDLDRYNKKEGDLNIDHLNADLSFETQRRSKKWQQGEGQGDEFESSKQGKGVISKSQRQDGKGIHVVSQSIAGTNPNGEKVDQDGEVVYNMGEGERSSSSIENMDPEEPFLIDCYDININGGKKP